SLVVFFLTGRLGGRAIAVRLRLEARPLDVARHLEAIARILVFAARAPVASAALAATRWGGPVAPPVLAFGSRSARIGRTILSLGSSLGPRRAWIARTIAPLGFRPARTITPFRLG